MTLSELISEVQNIVQDAAWSESMITALLNRGLLSVATGVILPDRYQLSPPLSRLYSTGTVTTTLSNDKCDLPADFNRDLIQVVNSDYCNLRVYSSFRQFLNENPEQNTGAVRCCSRHGDLLFYRDIPNAVETLTVHYYATPDTLVDSTDIPDCLPEAVQKSLLVGYACSEIFNQIEDGLEGQKINTNFWNNEFQLGLVNLGLLMGHDGDPRYYDDLLDRID